MSTKLINRILLVVIIKTLKIAPSNIFKSKRGKLKLFLLQIKINVHFNKLQFKSNTDKILYTATYLRDYTIKCFQLVLTNFLEELKKNCNRNINKIFSYFKMFKN